MTWEIVVGVITLCTFGIAIGKIVSNNTRVITELKCSIDRLAESMADSRAEQRQMNQRVESLELWRARMEEKSR